MPDDDKKTPDWAKLIGRILSQRGTDRGYRARVRRGIDSATETYAYGDVLPYVDKDWQQTALLRVAAMTATHTDLPNSPDEYKPFGRFCYQVSRALAQNSRNDNETDKSFPLDPGKPDVVASRLVYLPDQDLEGACSTVRRILMLANKTGVPLNYFDLAKTMIYWGDGLSRSSRDHRRKVLRDYYGGFGPAQQPHEARRN